MPLPENFAGLPQIFRDLEPQITRTITGRILGFSADQASGDPVVGRVVRAAMIAVYCYSPTAPDEVLLEASARLSGWMLGTPPPRPIIGQTGPERHAARYGIYKFASDPQRPASVRRKRVVKPVQDSAGALMWPFKQAVEKRDSSYTDSLISLLISQATRDFQDVGATWAAEVAGILYARAFAAAKITPKNTLTAAITPSVMGQIGRDLVRRGESLHWIDMDSGRMELRPAGSWDIRGGPRESDWRYRLDLHGPSLQESQFVQFSEVIHAKYQTDSGRPWRGVSPLAGASLSADLMAALELRLGQECSGPSGYVMPMPQSPSTVGDDDPLARLVADIKGSKGRTIFTESTVSGWGEGRAAAPARDWQPSRFGANPPETLKSLRGDAGMAVLAACGIPTAMVMGNSDGTAMREAYRRFVMLIVEPILDTLRAEIERKLETEVKFDLRALFAHDLQGRASAFQKLIAGGLSIQDSIHASGLLIIED